MTAGMLAFLLSDLANIDYILSHPWLLVPLAFQIWMLVDSIRRQEYVWAVFIFIFPLLNAILYYFMVYRAASPLATRGFELPGSFDRKRIKDLQAQIHHLDKAHHYSQLGDIYFHQGKLVEAEKCYLAALERDREDIDTRAHLGQCLLRQNKASEARPILEQICRENPKHDYGYSLMALAETLGKLGEIEGAIKVWLQVLESHSYARARVQLAELYLKRGEGGTARAYLEEVLADDAHAIGFDRKRDKTWIRQATKLLKQARTN